MQSLTANEEIVMKSVWELCGNCTLSQIVMQAKEHGKERVLQTVATFLKHLGEKEYVCPYKDGRFLYYEVLVKEETYKQYNFRKFLNFWWNGKIESFVHDVLQESALSPEEAGIFKECCNSCIN